MNYDLTAIRKFLIKFFSDEELDDLAFDYFRELFDEFASGMSKPRKARRIITYCDSRGLMADLVKALKKERPHAFATQLATPAAPALRPAALVVVLQDATRPPLERVNAGDTLALLGDPRPGVCTREPDMIAIAAGPFIYRDSRQTIPQPFAAARYPVTVAQFDMFMADGGYEDDQYWGGKAGEAWRWRVTDHPRNRGVGPVTAPRFAGNARWSVANRPVVGVSWYEAQAYCAWLAAKTGRAYHLPAEEAWARAARHTDGRQWAWGDNWQPGIANTREAGIGRTTAVGAFPGAAAECGADDMSGNVWEWTATATAGGCRRLRGGSWNNDCDRARVTVRSSLNPGYSSNAVGFRVAAPLVA